MDDDSPYQVRIQHPSCTELLKAVNVRPGRARLLEFSVLLPIGPGDLVKVTDSGLLKGIALPNAPFLVEAHLTLGISQSDIDQMVAEWGMATDVQQTSGATIRVQSSSAAWLEDVVRSHPEVQLVIPLRMPNGVDA